MAKIKKAEMQKTVSTTRKFVYRKGNVELNFTLSLDENTELKNFQECLTLALGDVTQTLKDLEE